MSENSHNSRMSRRNTSGYKGVDYKRSDKKWRASISVNGKHLELGLFPDAELAAKAYNAAAIQYFGEFASINLLNSGNPGYRGANL
jgi:hypothetical protein